MACFVGFLYGLSVTQIMLFVRRILERRAEFDIEVARTRE